MPGLIGRKVGMTRLFDEQGHQVPVTVIEAGPCPVVSVRTAERDGYSAVQLGFKTKKDKRASKAERGHATRGGTRCRSPAHAGIPLGCERRIRSRPRAHRGGLRGGRQGKGHGPI